MRELDDKLLEIGVLHTIWLAAPTLLLGGVVVMVVWLIDWLPSTAAVVDLIAKQ